MRVSGQRRALGVLFLLLAALFAGFAVSAAGAARDRPGLWVIVLGAGAIALWMASMAVRSWRAR